MKLPSTRLSYEAVPAAAFANRIPAPLAPQSVVRHHVALDDVVVDARHRRLRPAPLIEGKGVVPGNGDPAVGEVVGHVVVGHGVAVRRTGVVAQQHPAGVVGRDVVADRGEGDGGEVDALAAVTGDLPGRRAFEVGGLRRREAEAQIVVHHGAVADRDAGDVAPQPGGQDALALGALDPEAGEPDVGSDDHHGGEDLHGAEVRHVHLQPGVHAGFVDGGQLVAAEAAAACAAIPPAASSTVSSGASSQPAVLPRRVDVMSSPRSLARDCSCREAGPGSPANLPPHKAQSFTLRPRPVGPQGHLLAPQRDILAGNAYEHWLFAQS
jgi:hypothetical protein